jgi:hypothetical protein
MSEQITEAPQAKGSGKKPIGLNLSSEARRLLLAMAEKSGLSQTGVAELAIRERAEREGVK